MSITYLGTWEIMAAPSRRCGEPRVSISRNGQIGFNVAAQELLRTRDYSGALLMIDAARTKIGIEPCNKKHVSGFRPFVVTRKQVCINAKPVLRSYGLLPTASTSYTLVADEHPGVFVVVLSSGRTRGAK